MSGTVLIELEKSLYKMHSTEIQTIPFGQYQACNADNILIFTLRLAPTDSRILFCSSLLETKAVKLLDGVEWEQIQLQSWVLLLLLLQRSKSSGLRLFGNHFLIISPHFYFKARRLSFLKAVGGSVRFCKCQQDIFQVISLLLGICYTIPPPPLYKAILLCAAAVYLGVPVVVGEICLTISLNWNICLSPGAVCRTVTNKLVTFLKTAPGDIWIVDFTDPGRRDAQRQMT